MKSATIFAASTLALVALVTSANAAVSYGNQVRCDGVDHCAYLVNADIQTDSAVCSSKGDKSVCQVPQQSFAVLTCQDGSKMDVYFGSKYSNFNNTSSGYASWKSENPSNRPGPYAPSKSTDKVGDDLSLNCPPFKN